MNGAGRRARRPRRGKMSAGARGREASRRPAACPRPSPMAEWIVRKGSKAAGFRYVSPRGQVIRDARTVRRIEALRVPPGWRDVHIAASAGASVQAWGFDVKGRKQYRYHERAVQRG